MQLKYFISILLVGLIIAMFAFVKYDVYRVFSMILLVLLSFMLGKYYEKLNSGESNPKLKAGAELSAPPSFNLNRGPAISLLIMVILISSVSTSQALNLSSCSFYNPEITTCESLRNRCQSELTLTLIDSNEEQSRIINDTKTSLQQCLTELDNAPTIKKIAWVLLFFTLMSVSYATWLVFKKK